MKGIGNEMKEKLQRIFKNKQRLTCILMFGPAVPALLIGCVAGIGGLQESVFVFLLCLCLIYPVELLVINIVALVRAVRHPEKLLPGTF